MKKNILNALGVFALVLSMTSCDKTEGPLYQGPEDKISFMSGTTSLAMESGVLEIPVGRTSTAGDLSVPVTLTATGAGYTDVFQVAGPVEFKAGEGKAYAKINYGDFSKIDPSTLSVSAVGTDVRAGLAFPISLNIDDKNISYSNIKKININASNILTFEDLGTTKLDSKGGWEGAVLDVKIQKAQGANVYKVVNPFGGGSFAFMIKSDGKTLTFPNQVIYNHPDYGPVSMTNVTGTVSGKTVTINVAGYNVSAGSFGSGVEILTLP
ncbi:MULTISPECIES: hypothetical protein [unclassified Sphingobacterium]|uniref:hypothetical protein n=1 Tax=unclassified Sphingobacterium TaxID=2609468 RepID=UPI000C0C09E5|nr:MULTISPECIES: hypothetical protein [unclassified Sphingobacterium]QBR13384.1 hypothetical protein E3D81_14865 [Sphingobacterium sp. CZ-2]